MFIGHFAVGFALKKAEPKVPLGVWFAGAMFLDILWPVFLLIGIEKASVVPGITVVTPLNLEVVHWSHSLLMSAVWAAFFGAVVYWRVRTAKAFVLTAFAVMSHWLLDYVTHTADMTLAPHGAKMGLELWNSLAGTLVVELGIFVVGIMIYVRMVRNEARSAWIHFAILIVFFLLMYVAAIFGPPPPNNQTVLAVSALALTPVILWANWLDKKLGLRTF